MTFEVPRPHRSIRREDSVSFGLMGARGTFEVEEDEVARALRQQADRYPEWAIEDAEILK